MKDKSKVDAAIKALRSNLKNIRELLQADIKLCDMHPNVELVTVNLHGLISKFPSPK